LRTALLLRGRLESVGKKQAIFATDLFSISIFSLRFLCEDFSFINTINTVPNAMLRLRPSSLVFTRPLVPFLLHLVVSSTNSQPNALVLPPGNAADYDGSPLLICPLDGGLVKMTKKKNRCSSFFWDGTNCSGVNCSAPRKIVQE
jgi:hypothetical protein